MGSLQSVQAPPRAHVMGVPVNIVEAGDVVRIMAQWIEQRQRRWIAVTSSHGVVEAHNYPEFKRILQSADLSVPDGKWTARWAAWRASCAPQQVRGTDLLMKFCEFASRTGHSSFFYGDTDEVLALLTHELRRRFPALNIAGCCSPPFRPLTAEEDAQVVRMINNARPDVLWVGLGLPKQEHWIFQHRSELNVPVIVAVGAAFKFVSGKVKTAPPWMREWGLEWIWRLAHEPRQLWRRVLVYGPRFASHALLELTGIRKYD